ncbi:MAG: porin [Pseudomonadales bacterium]|nr:porin [Pseudomonadales bacterium]
MKATSVRYIPLLFTFAVTNAFGSSNTFYADFRYSLNQLDVGDRTTQGENNASRIGFKGHYGQSDSLTAFYHLQMGVNIDGGGDVLSDRFYYAGLKGNFGSIIYGRTSTAYKKTGLQMDPFYDSSAGAGFSGSNFGLSPLTNGWTDNSLVYTTRM